MRRIILLIFVSFCVVGLYRVARAVSPVLVPVSKFVSWSNVPSQMIQGKTQQVSITFKNDSWDDISPNGPDPWKPAWYLLRNQTSTNWKIDDIFVTTTVNAYNSYTFTFTITAPSNAGTYNFQWQMYQTHLQPYGFFGDFTPNQKIKVVAPSTSSPTPTPTGGGGGGVSVDLKLSTTSINWKSNLPDEIAPVAKIVDLKATVTGGSGKIDYYFWCNENDSTLDTTGYDAKKSNTNTNPWPIDDLCEYPIPGTYHAKVVIDRGGSKAENHSAIITVSSPAQTLDVELTADPDAGTAPLSSVLTADVSGSATGTINYSFWWNCTNATTNVATANLACGTLTAPPAGSCVETIGVGYKCDAISNDPKTIPSHPYTPADTYTAKVIAERGVAPPDQAQVQITVTPNESPDMPVVTATQFLCTSGKSVSIGWSYSDPEGDPQGSYRVRVFQGITEVHDSGIQPGDAIAYPIPPSDLDYDTTYTAAVIVWDDQGNGSLPGTSDIFTTLPHDKPWVDFTWPASPKTNKPVQFTDASTYDGGAPYAYGWNFNCNGKCNPAISTDQNPQTTFTQSGNYNVKLTIGDNTGLPYCSKTKTVNVGSSFSPVWREVRPW